MPWSDETLVAAALRNFREAEEWVDEHPGRALDERTDSLRAVLRIFNRSAEQFHTTLASFHIEAHDSNLFSRPRRSELKGYEERFRELLYVFASSAMTLVDQARAFSTKVELSGYHQRVTTTFSSSPQHRFVQELRVDLIHVALHRPGWQLTSGRNEESTSKFILWPKQLTRAPEYNSQARDFVSQHRDGIDLGELVASYGARVNGFHEWLHRAIEASVGTTIGDYKRCSKRIKAFSSRCWWNIVFQQVVLGAGRDPYLYLDNHLTAAERIEINLLPYRSKKQVDRIIELVDEFNACDAELRQIIYKAFGANDA